jgi:hypothetical protein
LYPQQKYFQVAYLRHSSTRGSQKQEIDGREGNKLADTALAPRRGTAHDPSLVVEVAVIEQVRFSWRTWQIPKAPEDDENTSTIFTKSVLHWYLDIVKGDISGTGGRRIARLNLFGLHTRSSFNKDDGESILSLTADSEVIGETGSE